MKKTMLSLVAGLLALAPMGFAAGSRQAQGDSMKQESMSQDSMSHDKMSHDKMSDDMAKPKVIKGWVSDSECAAEGNKKCANKEHVAKGAKLVLVGDSDKKIWTVSNPASLADHQGHHVQVKATADAEKGTIEVQEVKMLK